jgi:hypothetical protein
VAQLLGDLKAGILLNEHIAHACRLGAEGIVSKRVDGTYRSGPCRVWIKVRNPAISRRSGREARNGIDDWEGSLSHCVT